MSATAWDQMTKQDRLKWVRSLTNLPVDKQVALLAEEIGVTMEQALEMTVIDFALRLSEVRGEK